MTEIVYVNGVLMILISTGEISAEENEKVNELTGLMYKVLSPHFKEVISVVDKEVAFTDLNKEDN